MLRDYGTLPRDTKSALYKERAWNGRGSTHVGRRVARVIEECAVVAEKYSKEAAAAIRRMRNDGN